MVFVLWIRLKTSFANAKVVLLEGCVNFSTLMMMENEFEKGTYNYVHMKLLFDLFLKQNEYFSG